MTKVKKGNAQPNTRELIRENKELRDRVRNLTGKSEIKRIRTTTLNNIHTLERGDHETPKERKLVMKMRNQEISMQMLEKNITILKNIERGIEEANPKPQPKVSIVALDLELNGAIQGVRLDDIPKMNIEHGNERVRIREAIAHRRFEMPLIPHYEGHSDPMIHMQLYRRLMEVRGASEDVMCKFFPLTLGGSSLKGFNKLKPSSIQNFPQMCREFITRFRGARHLERKPNVLHGIKQDESETLKEYVERFHKEVINLGAYDEENTLKDFIRNIRICQLWFNFQDFRPKDYTEAYERTLRFVETKEQLRLKKFIERVEYGSKKEKGKGREKDQGDQNSRPMITGGIPRLQPRGLDQLKASILQPQPVMNVPN
ncbi:hypothetical protein QYF36_001002 [Acer negundo]|nr:hypothetical protein QYF36_001002 [Acer negundo]